MNTIEIIAFLSLILQIVTLSVVIFGYIMKRRNKFIVHGTMMLVAVIVQFFSFLFIMGPAFFIIFENGLSQRPVLLSIATLIHAGLGGASLMTGIWIAVSWHLQTSIVKCIQKRHIMRYLIITWILALVLGIILYLMLYII
jgi:uncharacterized membrane protein YozB (DUF420 family)